ncbi:Protein of unknown function [Collimonas sp. OK307]|nr:Protein of unknown function [Collimonas sp. OK307]
MKDMASNHNLSIRDIYDGIDIDTTMVKEEGYQRKIQMIPPNRRGFVFSLVEIEMFVQRIVSSEEVGFSYKKNNKGMEALVREPLAGYFDKIEIYLRQFRPALLSNRIPVGTYRIASNIYRSDQFFSDKYEFSEYVTLFFDACMKIFHFDTGRANHFESDLLGCNPLFFHKNNNELSADLFNNLILFIRNKYKTLELKKRIKARNSNAPRNYKSNIEYTQYLFTRHPQLFIARIDLGYNHYVTAKQAHKDRIRFLNNLRAKYEISINLGGFIWKLEYGEDRHYYFHFIFFYRDSDTINNESITEKIGDYWKNHITPDRGWYLDCKTNPNKYISDGIGIIQRREKAKRNKLLYALQYLTKKDQYLRHIPDKDCTVMGRGEMPVRLTSRIGQQTSSVDKQAGSKKPRGYVTPLDRINKRG